MYGRNSLLRLESNVSTRLLASFNASAYILSYAFGPLVIASLAKLFQVAILYQIGKMNFIVFTLASAQASNLNALMNFRSRRRLVCPAPLTTDCGSSAEVGNTRGDAQ